MSSIQENIGKIQNMLCAEQSSEAVILCRSLLNELSNDLQKSIIFELVSIALHMQGNIEEAITARHNQIELLEKEFGEQHYYVGSALHQLSILFTQHAQMTAKKDVQEKAFQTCLQAVTIMRSSKDIVDSPQSLGEAIISLSLHCYTQRNYAMAEELSVEALQLFEHSQGRACMGVSTCLNNLGRIYETRGEKSLAVTHHKEALAIRLEILGTHPETAFSLCNCGAALANNGDWAEAIETLEKAVSMYEEMGIHSIEIDACKKNIALCQKAIQQTQA